MTEILEYAVVSEPLGPGDPTLTIGAERPTRAFTFRFVTHRDGYLYILAPAGRSNVLMTFLTSRPGPSAGVTSNSVVADSEYTFPGGGTVLGITDTSTTFTVVFSEQPLPTPRFLAERAEHALTDRERTEWREFHGRVVSAEQRPAGGSRGRLRNVSVMVPAGGGRQPVAFDITVTAPE
jgi:hypothetical protein